jgi:hypothetical protein
MQTQQLPAGWIAQTDNQARTFYVNTADGTSHWSLPGSVPTAPTAPMQGTYSPPTTPAPVDPISSDSTPTNDKGDKGKAEDAGLMALAMKLGEKFMASESKGKKTGGKGKKTGGKKKKKDGGMKAFLVMAAPFVLKWWKKRSAEKKKNKNKGGERGVDGEDVAEVPVEVKVDGASEKIIGK